MKTPNLSVFDETRFDGGVDDRSLIFFFLGHSEMNGLQDEAKGRNGLQDETKGRERR